MEQTSILSNHRFRLAASAILLWLVVSALAIAALVYGYKEKTTKHKSTTPNEQFIFVSEFEVVGARLSSNSGEGLIKLGEFNIPVKFDFESSPTSIKNLEIGEITDTNKKHYNDFTNFQDHKAINAALVAYIDKRLGAIYRAQENNNDN